MTDFLADESLAVFGARLRDYAICVGVTRASMTLGLSEQVVRAWFAWWGGTRSRVPLSPNAKTVPIYNAALAVELRALGYVSTTNQDLHL